MKKDQNTNKERTPGVTKRIIRAFLFLIPALLYLPAFGGNVAVPPGESAYSDLLITHYPYMLYLRDSILSNSQIPLWSTLIQSGSPFAANPLAGLFYLPGWLAMIYPLPSGLSFNMAMHVVFGTWGMYLFLRKKELGETGSIVGALGFGLMPKLAAHFGAGHVSLIYSISWTPWLFYISEIDKKGWKTGIVAGSIFLADPRWSIYAGLFWVTYAIAHRQPRDWRQALYFLKASLIAALISAPLIIPLFQYLEYATRAKLTAGDMMTGSLPAGNLMGLIIPGSGGNTEWYFYSGGVLIGLFISQLFITKHRKRNRFWITWVILSILIALGNWGINPEWISWIPGLNMLRVPARSLFIAGICFPIIGAYSVDNIFKTEQSTSRQQRLHFGIILLGLMLLVGVAIITKAQPAMILWGFVFLTLCGLLLFFQQKIPTVYLGGIFAGLIVMDLLGAGWQAYAIQDAEIRHPDDIHEYLIKDEEIFRVYSPSYSIQQYLAAEYQLELVDGVDPMQLASYVEFVQEATGVDQKNYSVTIPPFRTGNPSQDNINADLDAKVLGLLNTKYILSEFMLDDPGLSLISSSGNGKLFANTEVLPRAWVEKVDGNQDYPDLAEIRKVIIVERTANSIHLAAEGPGRLVLSEIQYPGWIGYVDGTRTEIKTAYNILRSVLLDEGEHTVEFIFQPITVYVGLGLAGLGWIFLAYLFIRKRQFVDPEISELDGS